MKSALYWYAGFLTFRSMALRFLVFFLAFALAASLAIGGPINPQSLRASSNGTNIIVQWTSDDEAGVSGYTIERKSGSDGVFVMLTVSPILPEGSGHSYTFTDNSAFRVTDNVYQYRLTALYNDGRAPAQYLVTVTHNVSAVRRTWGSIKAMFR